MQLHSLTFKPVGSFSSCLPPRDRQGEVGAGMLDPAWSNLQEANLFLCQHQHRLRAEEEQLRDTFPYPPEGRAKLSPEPAARHAGC